MNNNYFLVFMFLLGLLLLIFLHDRFLIDPAYTTGLIILLVCPSTVFVMKGIFFLQKRFKRENKKEKEMQGLNKGWNKDF